MFASISFKNHLIFIKVVILVFKTYNSGYQDLKKLWPERANDKEDLKNENLLGICNFCNYYSTKQ